MSDTPVTIDPVTIDQHRRVVQNVRNAASALVDALNNAQVAVNTFQRILGNEDIADEALLGTGTTRQALHDALPSITEFTALLAGEHGANLEKFAR